MILKYLQVQENDGLKNKSLKLFKKKCYLNSDDELLNVNSTQFDLFLTFFLNSFVGESHDWFTDDSKTNTGSGSGAFNRHDKFSVALRDMAWNRSGIDIVIVCNSLPYVSSSVK